MLALVLMLARIEVQEGVFVDARHVPVALIGLFEGWPAGLLASVIPAVYRLSRGGAGAWPGAIGVIGAGLLGGLAYVWARRAGEVAGRHALGLSLAVFVTTVATFIAAGPYARALLERVWPELFVIHVVGIALTARLLRDVAARARLEAEQQRFRAVLDEASDAIWIVDAATSRVVDVNRRECELSGYWREGMIGHDLRDFWPKEPPQRARHEAALAEALARGQARTESLPYRKRSGEIVSVDAVHRVVEHEGRRYVIVVYREASDREIAESARREAAELRAAALMARTAAHEINNPLAVIMGSLDLLRRRAAAGSPEAKWGQQALESVERVRDIVARMSQIVRMATITTPPGNLPPILDLKKSSEGPSREEP